jgi:hypothetical protein
MYCIDIKLKFKRPVHSIMILVLVNSRITMEEIRSRIRPVAFVISMIGSDAGRARTI